MNGTQSALLNGGPIADIPIASGLASSVFTAFGTLGGDATLAPLLLPVTPIYSTNTTTDFVDAINYTGAGVIEFCAFYNRAVTYTEQVGEIIIDGISVFSFTAAASSQFRCPVGSVSYNATTYVHSVGLGAVPFKQSLQIRHKRGATSGTSYVWAKVRLTA